MNKKINTTLRNFFLVTAIMSALTGCDREYETIFNESPDERMHDALDAYNDLLMDAPFGWTAALYTGSGAGYFYYFDFHEDGRITMLSDFNETAAGEPMESTWALKALQRPTLSFTTYSYIHLPADPDGDISNGIPGSGLLSDFEFAIVRTSGDSVILQGVRHNSEIVFVRSTEEEAQAYQEKRIQHLLQRTDEYLAQHKGYRLTLPDETEVPMALSITQKMISFQFLDDDGETIRIPKTSFIFSIGGIILKEPIKIKDYQVTELRWDDTNEQYYVQFDEAVVLTGTDEPYIFNPSTPLHSVIGQELVTAVIPYGAGTNPLPGQSDEFTDIYNLAATQMYEGPYRLTLEEIKYVFVPNTDRMFMVVTISQPQGNGSVARFTGQYTYSYQVRDGGVVKFRLEGNDQNAGLLYADLVGILNHFDNDTFKLDYIGGGFYLIAGFASQEEPGYYFSGYLAE
ncbi:MAG TPA: DUF4302 domain-containing protein [Ohtaekwangia sp.]|nr:DUF4302 domain-containing protein [Ohtaekwangia sp.]